MQFVYDCYDGDTRLFTTTSASEALQELGKLPGAAEVRIIKTDARHLGISTAIDADGLESDSVAEERRVWLDVPAKKAIGWKPFDEEESGIHVKPPYDDNVKTAAAATKPKTSAIPPTAILQLGEAMQNGADKYGRFNWRTTTVSATVFYDAINRHLLEWMDGIDRASDSKVHHLAHIMANCAIILDAEKHKVFNDDRLK